MVWTAYWLAAVLQVAPPSSVWPQTIAGWVALIASIAALAGVLIGTGKTIARLDGYGTRMNRFEQRMEAFEALVQTLQATQDRALQAQELLLERIGNATKTAETCNEGTTKLGIDLGAAIHSLGVRVTEWRHATELELRELTTELRIRGHISPRPTLPRQADDIRG